MSRMIQKPHRASFKRPDWAGGVTNPNPGNPDSDYGSAVDLTADGNIMVVGAPNDGTGGLAYVKRKNAQGEFETIDTLEPSDVATGDKFGYAVTISADGTWIAVGSYSHTVSEVTQAGAVYIFKRTAGTDDWVQTHKLLSPSVQFGANFGASVSLNNAGNMLSVAATGENAFPGIDAKGLYVFSYDSMTDTWNVFDIPIMQPGGITLHGDGYNVIISGDGTKLFIGMPNATGTGGMVQTYTRNPDTGAWEFDSIIRPPVSAPDDGFGTSIDYDHSTDTLIVGSPGTSGGGAAHTFTPKNKSSSGGSGGWTNTGTYTPRDFAPQPGYNPPTDFGTGVSIRPDAVVVGGSNGGYVYQPAPSGGGGSSAGGSAYVPSKIIPSPAPVRDVVYSGDTVIISYPSESGVSVTTPRPSSTVGRDVETPRGVVVAPKDIATGAMLGMSIAVSAEANRIVAGAPAFDYQNSDDGAVYIFSKIGNVWRQEIKFVSADSEAGGNFGYAVDISANGSRIIVGAFNEDKDSIVDAGAAYIYTHNGVAWLPDGKLEPTDLAANDKFGFSVAISGNGNRAIVGAYRADGAQEDSGAIYVFDRVAANNWTQVARLAAPIQEESGQFGCAVAINGDGTVVAVGAFSLDAGTENAGAVYTYASTADGWAPGVIVTADDRAIGDAFGTSVALSSDGQRLAVGAPRRDDSGIDSGAAYVFRRSMGSWVQEGKLVTDDAVALDLFGTSVSLTNNGDLCLVGSPDKLTNNVRQGACFIFEREGNVWTLASKIRSDVETPEDDFGRAVDMSADGMLCVVGAPGENVTGPKSGAIYMFDVNMLAPAPGVEPSSDAQAPKVMSLSAVTGTRAGGETITITGANFRAGATVLFGANRGTDVLVHSTTSLQVEVPAATYGVSAVDVTVINTDNRSGVLEDAYTYPEDPNELPPEQELQFGEVTISAGLYHNAVLRDDGSIAAWGQDTFGQVGQKPSGNDFIAVDSQEYHSVALRDDGTIVAWGNNANNQVSQTPTSAGHKAIAAGSTFNLAIDADDAIVGWGQDVNSVVSSRPAGAFKAVAAGRAHAIALRSDGTLHTWGNDAHGQISQKPTEGNFVAIAAAGDGSAALTDEGVVYFWGRKASTSMPVGGNYKAIALSGNATTAATLWTVDSIGKVETWSAGGIIERAASGFVIVTAGLQHGLGLKEDGSLVAWGDNTYGQVGQTPTGPNYLAGISGEALFLEPGRYLFRVPDGVRYLSALAVGAGQTGSSTKGGDGGDVRYMNNIMAAPGQQIEVIVGKSVLSGDVGDSNVAGIIVSAGGGSPTASKGTMGGDGGEGGVYRSSGALGGGGGAAGRSGSNGGDGSKVIETVTQLYGWATTTPAGPTDIRLPDRSIDFGRGRTRAPTAGEVLAAMNTPLAAQLNHVVLVTATYRIGDSRTPSWAYYNFRVVSTGSSKTYSSDTPSGTLGSGRGGLSAQNGEGLGLSGSDQTPSNSGYGFGGGSPNKSGGNGAVRIIWGNGRRFPNHRTSEEFSKEVLTLETAPVKAVLNNTISACFNYTLGILQDGSLFIWGAVSENSVRANKPTGNDFVAVSAGAYHCLAIRSNGTLVEWGRQSAAPSGSFVAISAGGLNCSAAVRADGSIEVWGAGSAPLSLNLPTGNDFIDVRLRASTPVFGVALRRDGTVAAWGYPELSQLPGMIPGKTVSMDATAFGISTIDEDGQTFVRRAIPAGRYIAFPTPKLSSHWSDQAKLTSVVEENLYIDEYGRVYSRGTDAYGEVSQTPVDSGFASIAAGSYHRVAMRSDGTLIVWGDKSKGQDSQGSRKFKLPTAAPELDISPDPEEPDEPEDPPPGGGNNPILTVHDSITTTGWTGVAIKSDGSLVSWGSSSAEAAPTGDDFISIEGGFRHCLALRQNGSIVCWGSNDFNLKTNTPIGNFVRIASGYNHALAIKSDGSIVSWGSNLNGQVANTPSGNFVQIKGGDEHSLALKSDGSIVSWGSDASGLVSDTPTGNDFIAIAAGYNHSLALRSNGSIVSWGSNTDGSSITGQVSGTPTGNDFIAIAAGYYHSVAIKHDGSIVVWGKNTYGQVSQKPSGNDFIALAKGSYYCLAMRSDGSLVGWGHSSYGQVSNTPTTKDFKLPNEEEPEEPQPTYDPMWISQTNLGANSSLMSLSQDSAGNVYSAGMLRASGQPRAGWFKLGSDGSFKMGRSLSVAAAGAQNALNAIAVASDGSVYVTGYTTLDNNNTLYRWTLAKFNSSGALQWQKRLNFTKASEGLALAVGADSSVYVAGRAGGNSTEGASDVYVSRFSSTGAQMMNRRLTGSFDETARAIAVDGTDLYIAGTVAGDGSEKSFVVKLTGSGNIVWQRSLSSSLATTVHAICLDADKNVYVSGMSSNMAMLVKYDSQGTLVWGRNYNAGTLGGATALYSISATPDGSIFATGVTNVGTHSAADAIALNISPNGDIVWQKYISTNATGSSDIGNAILAISNSEFLLAGMLPRVTTGRQQGFVARLNQSLQAGNYKDLSPNVSVDVIVRDGVLVDASDVLEHGESNLASWSATITSIDNGQASSISAYGNTLFVFE